MPRTLVGAPQCEVLDSEACVIKVYAYHCSNKNNWPLLKLFALLIESWLLKKKNEHLVYETLR